MVQLSNPYMTTGKTIAFIRQTFVGKVMSLLFNILSRLAIAFLPRSKCLLISWLQSPSAVILEPPKIKSVTVSIVSPSIFHEVMGQANLTLDYRMKQLAKANRVLPRERTGHRRHPLPTTQEMTLHMDITRWSIQK